MELTPPGIRLIGLTGAAGCGKDTLAQGLVQYGYETDKFAAPIYDAVNAMFGWGPANWLNREWKEKPIPWLTGFGGAKVSPRILLQTLGTEWGRDRIDEDIWLKIAQKKHERAWRTIITDLRFDNEAQWIRDEGGLVFEIVRSGHDKISESSHASESGVSSDLISAYIINDDLPSKMIEDARRIIWASSGLSESSQVD